MTEFQVGFIIGAISASIGIVGGYILGTVAALARRAKK